MRADRWLCQNPFRSRPIKSEGPNLYLSKSRHDVRSDSSLSTYMYTEVRIWWAAAHYTPAFALFHDFLHSAKKCALPGQSQHCSVSE